MPNQLQAGNVNVADGASVNQRGGNFGETIVQQLDGKYAELSRRGQLWLCTTPAQAYVLPATTGGMPTIWNPAGSGRVFYILRLAAAWVSGTNVAGSLVVAATANAGAAIGTAAPIVTFTGVAPVSAGNPNYSTSIKWSPTTNTFTAAPTVIASTGFNFASAQPTGLFENDYDGSLAIYPGNAVSLGYTVTTSTALFWTTALIADMPYYA